MGIDIERERYIRHPFRSGLVADREDVDDLAETLRGVKAEIDSLRACEIILRAAIAEHAKGEQKTQRVVGNRLMVKLTYPDDYWQQSVLKELWEADPEQSRVYLRIATFAPNLREVKKLEAAHGNERFENYKSRLLSARQPSNSPPTVVIEERK